MTVDQLAIAIALIVVVAAVLHWVRATWERR